MDQKTKEPLPIPGAPAIQKPPALLEDIRKAAEIVSIVLLELKDLTKPDVSLALLDELAERRIRELGGEPAFKGYQPSWAKTPFPATVCMSVDWEVAHGIPGNRTLREGSIVTYDVGVKYKSGCGDAALTVAVGEVDSFKQKLMRHGREALQEGIKAVKAGQPISGIGKAIEHYCLLKNLDVIKDFSGHHIGAEVHEEPNIPSFHDKDRDDHLLEEGKVICIEPMI